MQIYKHHIIFDEISYDRQQLLEWYSEVEQYREDFAVVMNRDIELSELNEEISHRKKFKSRNSKEFTTIDTFHHIGKHIVDFPLIRKLADKFNFIRPLQGREVDILIYEPDFKFVPHIDFHMNCGIMFPILPKHDISPIDFYKMPPNETWERAKVFDINFERDFDYSYYYSTKHPSMFNGNVIHGVRNNNQKRVFLRFKCHQLTFDEVAALGSSFVRN